MSTSLDESFQLKKKNIHDSGSSKYKSWLRNSGENKQANVDKQEI